VRSKPESPDTPERVRNAAKGDVVQIIRGPNVGAFAVVYGVEARETPALRVYHQPPHRKPVIRFTIPLEDAVLVGRARLLLRDEFPEIMKGAKTAGQSASIPVKQPLPPGAREDMTLDEVADLESRTNGTGVA